MSHNQNMIDQQTTMSTPPIPPKTESSSSLELNKIKPAIPQMDYQTTTPNTTTPNTTSPPTFGPLSSHIPSLLLYPQTPSPEPTGLALDAISRGVIYGSGMFLGPALLQLAKTAAGCSNDDEDDECRRVYGMKPTSLLSNIAVSYHFIGAVLMPPLGAIVDHTPYRRWVGMATAGGIVGINVVQIYLTEETWFVMAILQAVGGLMLMSHDVARYAYAVELSADPGEQSVYNASFGVVLYVSVLAYLVAVTVGSVAMGGLDDVGVARLGQCVTGVVSGIGMGYAWRYLMGERGALRGVPEGQTLWGCGFRKMGDTVRMIYCEYKALRWFFLYVIFSESATTGIISIATTFMSHFLKMSGGEIGGCFFLLLVMGIPGARMSQYVNEWINPVNSAKLCMVVWIMSTAVAPLFLTGPETKGRMYFFLPVWGAAMAWLHPTHNTILCTIVPRGQQSELMGFYLFCGQILGWFPPLTFTILNEMGYKMTYGLASMNLFLGVALVFLVFLGSYSEAVERAKSKGNNLCLLMHTP